MGLFLFLLIYFIFISIFENRIRNKRIINFLFYINTFIIAILFIFNRENSDYFNYSYLFQIEEITNPQFEQGYIFIVKIIKKVGGNHNIIILLTGIIYYYTIFRKFRYKNKNVFIFLYFIFLLILLDLIQIRNTLMITIVYLSLFYYEKNSKIKAILLTIISGTIHKLGFIYIIFYLLLFSVKQNIHNYIKLIRILFLFFTFFILIYFICKEQIINLLFEITGRKGYFRGVKYSFLINLIQVLIDFIIFKILDRKYNRNIYFKFYLFSILLFPFCFISKELYSRIYRNSFIPKWLVVLNTDISDRKKIIVGILLILNAIISNLLYYFRRPEFMIDLLNQIDNIKFIF